MRELTKATTSAGAAGDHSLPGTARLAALFDGVIAIAITLLALRLKVPEPTPGTILSEQLRAMQPRFEMYLASFLLIGYFWVIHHRIFRHLARHDARLLWLNLGLLLPLTTLPFATELIGAYRDDAIATRLYFGTLSVAAMFQAVLWLHVRRKKLTVPLPHSEIWRLNFIVMTPLVIFGLGLSLSFVALGAAQRVYLLVFLAPVVRHHFAPRAGDD